jgi:lipopolysaccharide export system protein LptA
MVGRKTKALLTMMSALFAVAQLPLAALAQAPGDSMSGGGPIDIKAEEQEFAGDHIIARGHVRVVFKDSVIIAPVATLYRDEATGQPKRAIFTGHPHLVQGNNKIDADVLTFEMVTSRIIAEGHAHSEVENAAPPPEAEVNKTASASASKDGKKPIKKVAGAATPEAALAKAAATKGSLEEDDVATTEEPKANAGAAGAGDTKPGLLGSSTNTGGGPTVIITDSDKQVYDRTTGHFEAFGHVKVKTGDVDVLSEHLRMAYGVDRRPEAAVFTGRVSATQGANNTQSDTMTYFLNSKRLQATGHVRSKVIQSANKDSSGPDKSTTVTAPANEGKFEPIVNNGKRTASGADIGFDDDDKIVPIVNGGSPKAGAPVIIVSDTQDYNKESGRLDAVGNVKIFYEDTIGIGPKVVMTRNSYGQAEKVVFIGRSQITQPGKRWIGDRITMTINDRKVLAEGNTRAFILQKKTGGPAVVPLPVVPFEEPDTRLAGKEPGQASTSGKGEGQSKLSTTKVERPE